MNSNLIWMAGRMTKPQLYEVLKEAKFPLKGIQTYYKPDLLVMVNISLIFGDEREALAAVVQKVWDKYGLGGIFGNWEDSPEKEMNEMLVAFIQKQKGPE